MPASLLIAGWICQACRRARLPQPSLKLGRGRHSVPFRNLTIQSVSNSESELRRTRNIGIIAHIDAGKTTTTERMLYYSGFTRTIGDVDDGSTVTDFLPAERARGITIQSAAITFHWPPIQQGQSQKEESTSPINESELPRSTFSHVINLIDTPGHADFTFEVLRSVRILDGAVCILDGVAGVEAQTEKVWHQASAYMIPRIVYVNKLDRDGAAFGKTVKEIGSRLRGWPALCQIPWWEHGTGKFIGVGDVINLRGLRWKEGEDGKDIEVFTIPQLDKVDSNLSAEIRKARASLVEILSEFDEKMVEMYLEYDEDHLAIPSSAITESLRRCIMNGSGEVIPVFAGASFRNVGVQPLLDAVVDLLPDPSERPDPEITAGSTSGGLNDLLSGKLILEQQKSDRQRGKKAVSPVKAATPSVSNIEACALAFKVVNDPRRGVLVYVRVYSGALNRNALVFNTNLQVSERAPRLLKMYASEAMEIASIPAGHIGVIAGLKHARTGDTLISYMGQNPKTGPPAPLNSLQLRPIDVPPPVFFASLEAHSLSEEKHLSDTLALMLREDPSLHLSVDHESGQTLLSGMGELHLEIAKDRLINDFKAKASMGRIEIGYRECIVAESQPQFFLFENEISGKKGKASCTATVGPLNSHEFDATLENNPAAVAADGNIISINISRAEVESGSSESQVLPTHLSEHMVNQALINGALAALSRGPGYSFPIHSAHVSLSLSLRSDLFGSDSSPAAITSAARGAVSSALHSAAQANETSGGSGTALMEPVMNVTISVDEASLGNVVHDISSARGGQVISLDSDVEGQSEQLKAVDDRPAIDVMKIYAPPDPFGSTDLRDSSLSTGPARPRTVHARVPLKEMVGYLKHLRSMTGGRGTFVMSIDRFEKMSGMREKVALQELRGDM